MIHGNINPENILISRDGDWKLAGFNFATYDNYQTSDQVRLKYMYTSNQIILHYHRASHNITYIPTLVTIAILS